MRLRYIIPLFLVVAVCAVAANIWIIRYIAKGVVCP